MWANWAKSLKCPQHKCDPKVPSAADASSGGICLPGSVPRLLAEPLLLGGSQPSF